MITANIDQMRRFRSGTALKVANAATDNNTLAAAIIGEDSNYPLTPPYAATVTGNVSSATQAIVLLPEEQLRIGETVSFVNAAFPATVLDRTILTIDSPTQITLTAGTNLSAAGAWKMYRRGDKYGKHIHIKGLTVASPIAGWARFYSGIGNALPATFTKIGEMYMPATTAQSSGNKLDLVGIAGCPIFCVFTADFAVALAAAIDAALNVEGRWETKNDMPAMRS